MFFTDSRKQTEGVTTYDKFVANKTFLENPEWDKIEKLMSLPQNHVPDIGSYANPMRGHKLKCIFTRITGHPDLADNNEWFDCAECWICDRWSKRELKICRANAVPDLQFTEIILLTAFVKKRGMKRAEKAEMLDPKFKLGALVENIDQGESDNSGDSNEILNLASDENEDSDLNSEDEEKNSQEKLKEREANDSNVTSDSDIGEDFEDLDPLAEPKRRKKDFTK